ncbi:hypothetical protein HBI51_122060 [Parastagonospora nodorum]|nr:hypothetical protein HBI51_122060 [Parastagonospora nodorum]
MGNIGHLNCEPGTHSSKSKPDPNHSEASRIERDLSSAPHQVGYMDDADPPMIRRAAGRIPHVCIVGAGVAGMRCADILLHHGAKVTILEGRNRVGGRLCQSNALGHVVDLGPNWIHGTEHNPILDLARQTGTLTMNWDGRQAIFDSVGKQMEEGETAKNEEVVWEIIEQAMKYSNAESATIPAQKSLFNFFEEKVQGMFPDDKAKQETILQMAEMWGAFVGSPIQTQSLKYFWLEECIDGENLFVAGTYEKILKKIAESARKADLRLEHKVTKIVSREEDRRPRVSVELEGRRSETFDEVVMTAPLGWLKRNLGAFEPELPGRLKEAIGAIGYGHLDKVYITFPTVFWNASTPPRSSPSKSRDPNVPNVTATTAPIHQPSSDSLVNPSHYPGFTHWLRPAYATSPNPNRWAQEAMNLAALPGGSAHPTLLFYIHGPTSLHISSLLQSSPASSHTEILTQFFEPYYSRLPNYNPKSPDHQPKAVLATDWASDELAGYGSYSNFQTGLEQGDKDIEEMRKGLPEKGIWLAGEHTAPFVALGTVTGAWWAGEGVAKRISKAWSLKEPE